MVVNEQKWTPTVRRGPIAAEMKSPAPNSVDLPPLLGKLTVNRYMIERIDYYYYCSSLWSQYD